MPRGCYMGARLGSTELRGSTFLEGAWREARRLNRVAGQTLAATGGGHTRRHVLQALAGAGALAILPRPVQARASRQGPVAIVGGGIAGLSALWHLTEAGIEAHLFEARGRIGGRMFTLPTVAGPIEMGGQLVNSDHADMHRFARMLSIPLIDRKGDAHHAVVTDDGRPVDMVEAARALTGIAGQIDRDAARLDHDYATVATELDRWSVVQYLDRCAALMPQPWVRRLMEATCHTEYGAEPVDVSALELIFNMPTVEDGRFDVLGKSDERYLIAGGSASIPRALGERLRERISSGRRVTAIDAAPDGGVVLRFARGAAFAAARVIVATPASITRRIAFGVPLPALWRRYIAEVNLGRNEKVQMVTRSRPWEPVFGRGGELWQTGREWPAADLGWDGGVRPHTGPGSTWTWFLGGAGVDRLDRERAVDVAQALARDSDASIPGMSAAMVGARATAWRHDPMARGAYVNYRPGQLTTFASCIWTEENGVVQPVLDSGPVHFAGEHLSDAFVGYMNGGAQTGRLAAVAAARALGRSVPAAA